MTFLEGCVASCGLLLIVAGAGKLYASASNRSGADAIRRALGIKQRTGRVIELALAVTELIVGVIAILGLFPVCDGAAMAVLGITFCALLGYVRLSRAPGGCGCLGIFRNQHAVSMRTVTRAGLLICAGLAEIITRQNGIDRWSRPSFVLGIVSGSILLIALSDEFDLRTPVCHRPLLRAGAATMKALTQSSVFQAVATVAGPFTMPTHQRIGCTDEYRFTSAKDADRVVVFQVSHPKRGGVAVRALLGGTLYVPRQRADRQERWQNKRSLQRVTVVRRLKFKRPRTTPERITSWGSA